ncbi:hypothetical protein OROGR_005436 [Orobanche gracilis]
MKFGISLMAANCGDTLGNQKELLDCEGFGGHIKLNSQSLEDGDSNALLLPSKRTKKRKGVKQEHGTVQSNKKQKLSKPQKRKLKKLEGDEQKKLRLEKAIKTLNENTLPEYAYPLLRSTCNINRDETMKEKRRRVVHLSKEGLEDLCGDELSKKQDFPCRDESETEEIHLVQTQELEENDMIHPIATEEGGVLDRKYVPLESSQEPVQGNEVINCKSADQPLADISIDKNPDEITSSSLISCFNDEIKSTKSKDRTGENPATNFNELSNLPDVFAQELSTAATVVHVYRPQEVEDKRKDLPIVIMEQEIMEAINDHSNAIICGETGCGKTTQVPQFLYEAGYGSSKSHVHSGIIGVTQPRRVVVLATAKRVAYELGLCNTPVIYGNITAPSIPFGESTRWNDILLSRYSVIILDEAHERSLNTDILIGMLSRVIQIRQKLYNEQQKVILSRGSISPENMVFPLKLVLMSATLRVQDFTSGRLFRTPPPVIEVPTRQFLVTIYFSKKTEKIDYIGVAYKKVLAIHKKLPPGGILVFVTGQREVEDLCRKLRKASKEFIMKKLKGSVENDSTEVHETNSVEGIDINEINEAFDIHGSSSIQQTDRFSGHDEDDDGRQEENLASLKVAFEKLSGQAPLSSSNGEQAFSVNTDDDLEKPKVFSGKRDKENCSLPPGPLFVLPLYAMLPAAAQLRVFEAVKEEEQLVVVATNVAETSLIIPGIKYVVDTGRQKIWKDWTGHCYRLYSSAAFNNEFPDYSPAEVEKVPVHGVVLVLKSMRIKKVANFPFHTSPKAASLLEAENCLKALDALDSKDELTLLGKTMSIYPLSPRHYIMILTVIKNTRHKHEYNPSLILEYAVAAAAALSLPNPFAVQYEGNDSSKDSVMSEKSGMRDSEKDVDKIEKLRRKKQKEAAKAARRKFRVDTSDALTIAYALQCFKHSQKPVEFCDDNALHIKTMEEMSKLRQQLLKLVFYQSDKGGFEEEYSWIHGTLENVDHARRVSCVKYPLSLVEEELICQAICAGWVDRVAKRIIILLGPMMERKFLAGLETKRPNKEEETSEKRAYMYGVTSVKPAWLVEHAKSSCTFSAPLTDPKPFYDAQTDQVKCWVIPTFGRFCLEFPMHSLPISSHEHRIQVFVYALLDGQVCPCLKSVRKLMSASPESIMKREAFGHKRVGNLLIKLKSRAIDSSAMLSMVWKENPKELFSEILDWFQKSCHKDFEELWLKMLSEVLLETQEHSLHGSFKRKLKGKSKSLR